MGSPAGGPGDQPDTSANALVERAARTKIHSVIHLALGREEARRRSEGGGVAWGDSRLVIFCQTLPARMYRSAFRGSS